MKTKVSLLCGMYLLASIKHFNGHKFHIDQDSLCPLIRFILIENLKKKEKKICMIVNLYYCLLGSHFDHVEIWEPQVDVSRI